MGQRCKHGLLRGQCSVCRKEAARAEALKQYREENEARAREAKASEK